MWKFTSKLGLGLILVAAASFMLYSSYHEAAIVDESAHIPAGYGYVRYLDYRLNPEHPPLVKALAALPLLLLQPTFPIESAAWQTMVNGQWDMGHQFLYESGNDASLIVHTARLFPIILTLLLILTVWKMTAEKIGPMWALLPAFLTAMAPLVLGHGHYVTTDIGATLGIILTLWRVNAYLENPSRKNLWLAGLSLGAAELLKFSAVLLIPYVIFVFAAHWFINRRDKKAWSYVRNLIFIFIIAFLVVVYPVYGLFTIHYPMAKQVSDTTLILGSFGKRSLANLDIQMAGHALTRPLAEYMLGVLMVMQRADGGNTAYFLGHVSAAGSRLYFPLVYLLKESIPALLIVWLPFLFWLIKSRKYKFSFLEFNLAGFVAFYWLYSIKSPLNIGLRHVLPTIPLLYILAGFAWQRMIVKFPLTKNSMLEILESAAKSASRIALKSALLIALLLWAFLETAFAAPHFLSYFNEFADGTMNGYRYVTDSNYDWGQDLLYLKDFVDAHPEVNRIAVDYFGGGDPKYYLGEKYVSWGSDKGDPRAVGINWVAISVNSLEQATQPTAPGFDRKPQDEYPWLVLERGKENGMGVVPQPDYRIGTSIFVYHLK